MAGYVYVTVGGNAVNDGIMLMNGSGGGDTGGSYRLQWTNEGGFTGTGWEVLGIVAMYLYKERGVMPLPQALVLALVLSTPRRGLLFLHMSVNHQLLI